MFRYCLILLILFPSAAAELRAQNSHTELWMEMERGIALFDAGRLGDAMTVFRKVAEKDPSYANAHLWIGNILAAEGEYGAARRKYEDSLEDGRNFFPRSMKIEAYYAMAEVCLETDDIDGAREYLEKVLKEGRQEALPRSRQKAMVDKFLKEGPDKLLELYRLTDKTVRRAYQMTGELDLGEGRYQGALESLLLSLTTSLSLAIEAERIRDPEYLFIKEEIFSGVPVFYFENTADLLKTAWQEPQLKRYFEDTGLYRQLFLLGMALVALDKTEAAQSIFLLVTDNRECGIWFDFAQQQIHKQDLSLLPIALRYR